MAQAEADGRAIAVRVFWLTVQSYMLQYKNIFDMSRNVIRGDSAATIAAAIEAAHSVWKTRSRAHRLPAIRDLAKTLKVSPVTVASAYRLLRDPRAREGQRPSRHRPSRARAECSRPTIRSRRIDGARSIW